MASLLASHPHSRMVVKEARREPRPPRGLPPGNAYPVTCHGEVAMGLGEHRDDGRRVPHVLIVVFIALVVWAIVVVSRPRTHMVAHQNSAIAALKQFSTCQTIWRNRDLDRNGAADYWIRDVAGFHCVHDESGRPIALIDLSFAQADRMPGRAYPELAGSASPRQGYFFQTMRADRDGNPTLRFGRASQTPRPATARPARAPIHPASVSPRSRRNTGSMACLSSLWARTAWSTSWTPAERHLSSTTRRRLGKRLTGSCKRRIRHDLRGLMDAHPLLGARDALHAAACREAGAEAL